jgi:nucleoside-diphosphate-sugar epimerase
VIYGDGAQTRDFVYVGDAVTAALACADRTAGCEIVNVCSGIETSIRTLAERVIALTGSSSGIACHAPPAARTAFEVQRSVGSRAKLAALMIKPPTALDDGLRCTIADWLSSHATTRPCSR